MTRHRRTWVWISLGVALVATLTLVRVMVVKPGVNVQWSAGVNPAQRAALEWYLPPSLLFLIFRWPFQGLSGGMDLVAAGFPAFFALAWICAHDSKRTTIAALLLASAHIAFWRILLDSRFDAVQIG